MNSLENKVKGSLYGFAIGDAMGASTEFMNREDIPFRYHGKVEDIVGQGWLDLKPGEVTDDTQMMICIMKAIMNGGDTLEIIECIKKYFIEWYDSKPKDIGRQCSLGIKLLKSNKTVGYDASAQGNGALMRALPFALIDDEFLNIEQGLLTHNNEEQEKCIKCYHDNIVQLLKQGNKIVDRSDRLMMPSGRVYNTLNNAIYYGLGNFTFEQAIIGAVNDGGDADTIAALTGGLSGARYGINCIPYTWVSKLDKNVVKIIEDFSKFILKTYLLL